LQRFRRYRGFAGESPHVHLWADLSAAERKIISLHIWGAGSEPSDYADEVAEEFGVAEKSEKIHHYYAYTRNGLDRFKARYAGNNSAL
jgi:hypothetical protein